MPIYPVHLTDPRTAIVRTSSGPDGVPVASGPFRLEPREPENIALVRDPQYWRGTPPKLDAIEFRTGLSAAAMAAGFRAGEIDLARDLLPQDLDDILREARFHDSLVEAPQKFTYFILFSALTGPAARNAAVRRALSGSIRRRDLVWHTLGRFAVPATSLIPPGILGHHPGRRTNVLTLEEARAVLKTARCGDRIRLRAAVHPLYQDRYASLLQEPPWLPRYDSQPAVTPTQVPSEATVDQPVYAHGSLFHYARPRFLRRVSEPSAFVF